MPTPKSYEKDLKPIASDRRVLASQKALAEHDMRRSTRDIDNEAQYRRAKELGMIEELPNPHKAPNS